MRLNYPLLKLAQWVSVLVPRRVAYGIARRGADIYFRLDKQGRENVIANLRRIHDFAGHAYTDAQLARLARENFRNFAKYLVDFFKFLNITHAQIARLIDLGDIKKIDQLLQLKRGLIILSAHFGNWELGAGVLAKLGYPVNAVALKYPDPKTDRLYQRQRLARGLKVILHGRAARACLDVLRKNELVLLVGDRDFTTARDTAEFFGKPARLPFGPAKLALASGAPILPVFLVRMPDETFRFYFEEPIFPDRERDTPQEIVGKFVRVLEKRLSEHPEQWFLFHNLWDIEQDFALAATMISAETPEAVAEKSE
jgi:lauroyl/myristoyl acyltransferase